MDVSSLSFNSLLLLERIQLSWFPGWVPEKELAIALAVNPHVAWFIRNKCPQLEAWIEGLLAGKRVDQYSLGEIRQAEETIMRSINDLLVYVVDPQIYDAQPFLGWDSSELTSLVNFKEKTVIDVGSGTGRLALIAAELAKTVFAVEPVANLRYYLKKKARRQGYKNVYPVDGLITDLPFPDKFAHIVMGGHVFGDDMEDEQYEMCRVAQSNGLVILCPGNDDKDNVRHSFLVGEGFSWSTFEEPGEGMKRKYWKRV
jgi:SAM-dependent methyltransferase